MGPSREPIRTIIPAGAKPHDFGAEEEEDEHDDGFFDAMDPATSSASSHKAKSSSVSDGWGENDGWGDLDNIGGTNKKIAPVPSSSFASKAQGLSSTQGSYLGDSNSSSSSRRSVASLSPGLSGGGGKGLKLDGLNISGSSLGVAPLSSDDLFDMLNDGPTIKKPSSSSSLMVRHVGSSSSLKEASSSIHTSNDTSRSTMSNSPSAASSSAGSMATSKRLKGRLQAKKLHVGQSDWDDF